MNLLTSFLIGIGLSAASGFRAFLPFLGMSIFALSGHLELAEEFNWVGTYPALAAFAVATIVEIASYYSSQVEELLDTVAVPLSVAAGSIVTASCVVEMSSLLKWGLAIIAGGGVSGAVKSQLMSVRRAARTNRAGAARLLVATIEIVVSFVMTASILSVPYFIIVFAFITLYIMYHRFNFRLAR